MLIEYRSYAADYATFRRDPQAPGETIDRVREIEYALVEQEIEDDRHG